MRGLRSGVIVSTLTAVLILSASGCVTVTNVEKRRLKELDRLGVDGGDFSGRSPWIAGFGNLVFGMGDLYCLVGEADIPEKERRRVEGSFAVALCVNIVLWPWTVPIAIPEAAIDARRYNRKLMAHYYYETEEGKALLEEYRAEYEARRAETRCDE